MKKILARLEELGDPSVRNRASNRGVEDQMYGVKMGDVRKLAKELKLDAEQALELWDSGWLEAQLLAILSLKPNQLSLEQMQAMVESITSAQVAEWFCSYLAKKHKAKEELRACWMKAQQPWAARAGWSLTAAHIAAGAEDIDLDMLLDRIEKEMPKAPAEVQWTMNFALAEIGIHHVDQRDRALEIGERLGIYRDYPVSKGCTSPYAPIWIREMVSRQG